MNNPRQVKRWMAALALLRALYVALAAISAGSLVAAVIILFTRKL